MMTAPRLVARKLFLKETISPAFFYKQKRFLCVVIRNLDMPGKVSTMGFGRNEVKLQGKLAAKKKPCRMTLQ